MAGAALLLVAWVAVIRRARRGARGPEGSADSDEADTPRWAVVAASVAPPLLACLVFLAAAPRFGDLRVALEGLSFEVGPRAVAEVRVGGSPELDHLVVRDLPPGFLTFRPTRDGDLVVDLHPQSRAGSARPAGEEPDQVFALARVGGDGAALANSFEIGDGDRMRIAGGGELTFDAGRPALGPAGEGYPELARRTGRAGLPIARQLPPEAEILPLRYYGAKAESATGEAGEAGGGDTVLVGIGGRPLGAFLYRGGGYLRSDFRVALPGPEVEVVRAGGAEGEAGSEAEVAAFDPRLTVLAPGESRRFALYRVDYAPPPDEEGDARSRIQERRSFEAVWRDGRLELVLDTPSYVQLGEAALEAGGGEPALLAMVGDPGAAAAMDDDPSLLVFRILGGPLAAELFSSIRVDGGEVLATTHTGARRYRLGDAFRVGDRAAAVVRVSRLGVPWGTMLLLWATALAALLAGWGLRHRPLPLILLTGVELFLATRVLVAYQGAFLDPGAAEAAWISVAAWAWVPWVLQGFLALHRSWREVISPALLAHLAVAAAACGVALVAAGSEPLRITLALVLPPLCTAAAVFVMRWLEGSQSRARVSEALPTDRQGWTRWAGIVLGMAALLGLALALSGLTGGAGAILGAVTFALVFLLIFLFLSAHRLLGHLPGWRPGQIRSTRTWTYWVLGLAAGLAFFRLLPLFGAGWKERADLGGAALAVSIYYTPLALFVLALAWGGRRRRWGVFVGWAALAIVFGVPAMARDWGALLIFSLPPVLLFALAAFERGDRPEPAAAEPTVPAWQRWLYAAPLTAVLLLHGLGVFVLPWVFGAGPSPADLEAARTSPTAARDLLEAGVEAEANRLRLWSWAAPEALQRVGTSSSEGLQVVMATLESYASRGPWGEGYLGVPLSSALDATHLDDNLSAVHVLGTFGWLGALALLAALATWALAPLLLPRPPGHAGILDPRGAFGLMILWTFTCAGLYMFSANVGLMLFTGKNVYFLAAASLSDVVEGTLLAALALWALCATPKETAGAGTGTGAATLEAR